MQHVFIFSTVQQRLLYLCTIKQQERYECIIVKEWPYLEGWAWAPSTTQQSPSAADIKVPLPRWQMGPVYSLKCPKDCSPAGSSGGTDKGGEKGRGMAFRFLFVCFLLNKGLYCKLVLQKEICSVWDVSVSSWQVVNKLSTRSWIWFTITWHARTNGTNAPFRSWIAILVNFKSDATDCLSFVNMLIRLDFISGHGGFSPS